MLVKADETKIKLSETDKFFLEEYFPNSSSNKKDEKQENRIKAEMMLILKENGKLTEKDLQNIGQTAPNLEW